eukprot:g20033.t1
MLSWLNTRSDTVERLDPVHEDFQPARVDYYTGRPGGQLQRLLTARRDFLAVWREADFKEKVSELTIFGRQIVVVNSPEAIKYVVATRHENFERKTPQMRRALEYLLGDGLFISDGETWKQRRPLVSDIVHKNRVPAFGPVMTATSLELVRRWEGLGDGAQVNALFEMAGLTAEIISRSVFGNDLGQDSADAVTEGFTSYQSLIDSINIGYFLGFDEGLPQIRTPSLRRSVKRIHAIIDRVIEDHLAGKGDGNSMVELLVRRQQRNPELKLDVIALRNEAATIFMAGHETTAATLTWVWYLLAKAPWVEEAVHAELDAVCGTATPAVEHVPQLKWCTAVIEEALRLYPPVPILARQAKQADRIGKLDVKPASLQMIVPWILHRTPSLFPDPHHFKPERFLDKRPIPYSYIPFAAGPRVCPGLQFGLTEAILCLAVIAQRFRVRVADGHRVEPAERETLLRRNWEAQGRIMTEFSAINRLLSHPERITLHDFDRLVGSVRSGPVIIVGMHLGNWEIGPTILHAEGIRPYANYIPPKGRAKAWISARVRRRGGLNFLPPGAEGIRPAVKVLKQGGVISMFCDEGVAGKIRGPLFGRPPHLEGNLAVAVRLARMTGATICPWYNIRGEGLRFDAYFLPPIILPPEDRPGARIAEDIGMLNAAIEPVVLAHLDQWYFLDNALVEDSHQALPPA